MSIRKANKLLISLTLFFTFLSASAEQPNRIISGDVLNVFMPSKALVSDKQTKGKKSSQFKIKDKAKTNLKANHTAKKQDKKFQKEIRHKKYRVRNRTYYIYKNVKNFQQTGKASWYGKMFHGRKTASGEIYNMHGLTAAHRNLPLGTKVQVTNLKNGRKVILKVNDRGPFYEDRIIDVSKKAAAKLGFIKSGLTTVHVKVVD